MRQAFRLSLALLATVLVLTVLLAACGGQAPGSAPAKSSPPADQAKAAAPAEQPKAAPAQGVKFPAKNVEIVVPFTAGGGADTAARAMTDFLSKRWGVPVIVTNKPGGGAVPGTRAALIEAAPDGHTALFDVHTSSTMMVAAMLNPPVTLADRKYAGRIIVDPFVFAVKSDAPWKDFKEFSAWVKAKPAELVFGSVGPAGPSRFVVADWLKQMGVDLAKAKMVLTEGGSDSAAKLAGGHINLAVHTIQEVFPLAQGNKIKVLAVLAEKRSEYMPEVPTAEELGIMKGVNVRWWGAIALPKAVDAQVLKHWEGALADLVKDPSFLEKMKTTKRGLSYLNAADTDAFAKQEAAFYTEFAQSLGIRN